MRICSRASMKSKALRYRDFSFNKDYNSKANVSSKLGAAQAELLRIFEISMAVMLPVATSALKRLQSVVIVTSSICRRENCRRLSYDGNQIS